MANFGKVFYQTFTKFFFYFSTFFLFLTFLKFYLNAYLYYLCFKVSFVEKVWINAQEERIWRPWLKPTNNKPTLWASRPSRVKNKRHRGDIWASRGFVWLCNIVTYFAKQRLTSVVRVGGTARSVARCTTRPANRWRIRSTKFSVHWSRLVQPETTVDQSDTALMTKRWWHVEDKLVLL